MENKEEIHTALEGNTVTFCIELKYKFRIVALSIVFC